jgi:putative cardiolipin synthase
MHNKLMVADNHVAVAGGRNIGDEYFGLAKHYNFRDLDVLVTGKVVEELSDAFDVYWNSEITYPARLLSNKVTEKRLERLRASDEQYMERTSKRLSSYPMAPERWREMLAGLPGKLVPGDAHVVQDEPIPLDGEEVRVIDLLGHLTEDTPTQHELLISSPYLIPTGSFMDDLKEAVDDGVNVRIVTGSMGSNNQLPAHVFYAKYRKRILKTGVELYEFHHEPSPAVREAADVPPVRSEFISSHMKAFVGDRKRCYIGSLNLDPRALDLNTENGLFIESPELGERLAQLLGENMSPENAWRATDDGTGKVSWTSDLGTVHRQPARSFWQRVKGFFWRMLPIEKQL